MGYFLSLRRNLFGLPNPFSDFVKNVKVGMLLFLFEYEKRLLYGVFKAVSDGEIDIVPTASGLSGNRFPAQVRISRMWNCNPLSENDFIDAIKDNYFRTNKFHFGLSKYQVRKLLHLFSSRKISGDSDFFNIREFERKRYKSSHCLEGKSEDPQSHDIRATRNKVSLAGTECWLPGEIVKDIVSKQVYNVCCSDIREGYALEPSPSFQSSANLLVRSHPPHDLMTVSRYNCCNYCNELCEMDIVESVDLPLDDLVTSASPGVQCLSDPCIPVSQNSVSLLAENQSQYNLATVRGHDCCNCSDELGDFIPLFVHTDDEDVVEGDAMSPNDEIEHAHLYTVEENLYDPYIPMPIFRDESSQMIDTNQDSAVGPGKYPVVKSSSDARKAESVCCQDLCTTSKAEEVSSTKYLDSDTLRKSVFLHLNFASKEIEVTENCARVDQFPGEIMGELQHKQYLSWKTMKGASSAERVDGDINMRRNSVFLRLGDGFPNTMSTGQ